MIDFGVNYSVDCIQRTESLLASIAIHLAKKKACRKQMYRVAIGLYDDKQAVCRTFYKNRESECYNWIFFDSTVQLKHHNSFSRKNYAPVIQHIIIEHFYEIYAGAAYGNQVQIKSEKLIPGIYEYKLSASRKYRKWFKIV